MEKHITLRRFLLGLLFLLIVVFIAVFTPVIFYEKHLIPKINNINEIQLYEATIFYNRFYIDVYKGKYNLTDEWVFKMEENLDSLEIQIQEMKDRK